MQGWGSQYGDDEKISALFRSIQNVPEGSKIIMLQECGDPKVTHVTHDSIFTSPYTNEKFRCHANDTDPTAFVKRCSTAILASEELAVTSCGNFFPYGISRPVVYVEIDGICYATLHAIANSEDSVLQVKSSIEKLSNQFADWVLLGDFNSQPWDYVDEPESEHLNNVLITGTQKRPGISCKMIFSDSPTQGANGNRDTSLDFAFVSNSKNEENIGIYDGDSKRVINIQQYTESGCSLSDHNLIGLELFYKGNAGQRLSALHAISGPIKDGKPDLIC